MSETKQRSINAGPPPLLLGCGTDGAGGLVTPIPQRGSSADAAGDTSAWTIVDAAAGRIQVTLGAGVAGSQLYLAPPSAWSGADVFLARAFMVDPTTIEIRVFDETQAPVNLDTTVANIQLIAHQV